LTVKVVNLVCHRYHIFIFKSRYASYFFKCQNRYLSHNIKFQREKLHKSEIKKFLLLAYRGSIRKTSNSFLLSWKVPNESLNLSYTRYYLSVKIFCFRSNRPARCQNEWLKRKERQYQNDHFRKTSTNRPAPRFIRRPLANSLSLSRRQALEGDARHPTATVRWVKGTQIRKHESRFYRRPEVLLKYPSIERATAATMEKERMSERREGVTISSLFLIFSISAVRSSYYARYFELFGVKTYEKGKSHMRISRISPPSSSGLTLRECHYRSNCYMEKLLRRLEPTNKHKSKIKYRWRED